MTKYNVSEMWDYYTARLLSDGVNHNELVYMRSETKSWEDWCDVWCGVGTRHELEAEEALERNSKVTAGEEFWLASLYFHYGQYLFWHDQVKKSAASIQWQSELRSHMRGLCYRATLGCPLGIPIALVLS